MWTKTRLYEKIWIVQNMFSGNGLPGRNSWSYQSELVGGKDECNRSLG